MNSIPNAVTRVVTGSEPSGSCARLGRHSARVAAVGGKVERRDHQRPEELLPGNAGIRPVLGLQGRFPNADAIRPSSLSAPRWPTARDKALVARDAAAVRALGAPPRLAGVFPGSPSPDGLATYLTVPLTTGADLTRTIADTQKIARTVGTGDGGLQVRVTGPAGFLADTRQRLRQHQHEAPVRLGAGGRGAAADHLPQPVPVARSAALVGLFADVPSRAPLPTCSPSWLQRRRRGGRHHHRVLGSSERAPSTALLLISRYREELRAATRTATKRWLAPCTGPGPPSWRRA